MTATFILHVAGLFVLIAASEMLNGIARTVFLNKRVGVKGTIRELDPKYGANLIIVKEIEVLTDR